MAVCCGLVAVGSHVACGILELEMEVRNPWCCLGATALAAQHFSLQQHRSQEGKGVWPALGREGGVRAGA